MPAKKDTGLATLTDAWEWEVQRRTNEERLYFRMNQVVKYTLNLNGKYTIAAVRADHIKQYDVMPECLTDFIPDAPPDVPLEERTYFKPIRLAPGEVTIFEKLAAAAKMNLSEWFRQAAFEKAQNDLPKQSPDLKQLRSASSEKGKYARYDETAIRERLKALKRAIKLAADAGDAEAVRRHTRTMKATQNALGKLGKKAQLTVPQRQAIQEFRLRQKPRQHKEE